ncbi:MAG: MFS transporter [Clostridia bacterium]|nr:MFS transporter [Clostridia bacterium]
MKKHIQLLHGGLFDKPVMDSRVKSRAMTKKELILGHLIGPLGLIFVVNTVAALVEKFFTQQTGAMYGMENVAMIQQMGGVYEVVMTAAKLLGMLTSLLNGWLMQKTHCRQGRTRPWHLIFGFVSIIVGSLIFLFPGNTLGEGYWYYFFFLLICYHTIGSSYFYVFRDNICSLVTRSPAEKTRVKFIRQMSWTLISGIVIGMVVNMVVLPMWLEHDINGYAQLLIILSIIAIPLLLVEYYYTKERVIEDVAVVAADQTNAIPLKQQLRALLTNRYYLIFLVLATLDGIASNFKGGNVQYFYIKYMLGGEANPMMYTIYQVVTGVPLGIGAFAIYPLAKKFGVRNVSFVGFALIFLGSILGWMFPSNLTLAMVAGFIRQMGYLPHAYITATLFCFAFDSVEYKSGFRLEGLLGISIIGAIQTIIYAPFAGGFESSILRMGFVDVVGVIPSGNVTSFMTLAFYLFDIILAGAYLFLLPLMDVEKHMPEINAGLLMRRMAAVEAKGEVWVDPEEAERLELEAANREHEANRIADLKERCKKKGLDFERENQKYLDRQAKKAARKKGT